jgi:hypothetical protein
MNFSQFLVENPDLPLAKPTKPNEEHANIEKERDTTPKDKKKELVKKEKEPVKKLKDKIFDTKPKTILQEERTYQQQQLKRGDFVIIQRLENSHLNIYKGYFGQIKEYRIIDESAYVILEAMNYPTAIKFPAGHLVHRTKFF